MSTTRNADPDRATMRPDPDRLNTICMNLAERHGDLEVTAPNPCTGSVRIVQKREPRRSWRVSAQGHLIAETPSQWGNGGNRS